MIDAQPEKEILAAYVDTDIIKVELSSIEAYISTIQVYMSTMMTSL